MDEKKALSLLGLAMRAGQVTHGDGPCEREVRAGRAALVLLDEGVSESTRDRYIKLCRERNIPLHETSRNALGRAIGKENRMVAAVPKGSLRDRMAALLFEAASP